MRKSGPLRNIRLCAYTLVGADSSVTGVVTAGVTAPREAAEGAGALAGLVDLRCHNTHTNMKVGTAMRTIRRTRIQIHSMGTVSRRSGLAGTLRNRLGRAGGKSRQNPLSKMRIHDQE